MIGTTPSLAQQYLVMSNDRGDIEKIQTFHEVGVWIHDSEEFFRGYLTSVGDSSISVEGDVIYLSEIMAIRIYRPFFKTIGVAQRIAAGGIIGLNTVNNLLSGYRPVLSEGNIIWAGALFATSYVWDLFSRKTYRAKNGWQWETIDFARLEE